MEVSGEHLIPAPRTRVWQALNDPAVLRAALPGCEDLVKVSEREYAGRLRMAIGGMDVVLRGRLLLGDLDPPRGCVLSAEGQGGAAGWARGSARIGLTEEGGHTRLSWHGTAELGGKLASVGNRVLTGVADRTAQSFFGRLSEAVGGGRVQPLDAAPPAPPHNAAEVEPLAPAAQPMPAPAVPEPRAEPPAPRGPWTTAQTVIIVTGFVLWLGVLFLIFLSK